MEADTHTRFTVLSVAVYVILFMFIVFEYQQIEDLRGSVANLRASNSELASKVTELNKLIDQQNDQINRLKIPEIVKRKLGVPELLVDYMARPLLDSLKARPEFQAVPVDLLTSIVKPIIRTKLSDPTIQFVDATRITGNLYSTNLVLTVPVKLSDIPLASIGVNVVGDFTFRVNINLSAQVDAQTQIVSNVQYVGFSLG